MPMSRGLGPGGVWGGLTPLESGIYIVKKILKTFLIYWDPPWIKIVPWPLLILKNQIFSISNNNFPNEGVGGLLTQQK